MTLTDSPQALESPPPPVTPVRKPIGAIPRYLFPGVFWLALITLSLSYLVLGDISPLGEALTIWPPMLWLFLLIPLSLPMLVLRQRRQFLAACVCLLLFLGATEEWRPLLRFFSQAERATFDQMRSMADHPLGTPLRVITWNISDAGKDHLLPILEELQPDLCLLQETPDGPGSIVEEELEGHWSGFHWIDAGDCGVLSRYPIRVIDSLKVGPWSRPQALILTLPDGQEMLVVNVRLMLPQLLLNPFDRAQWKSHVQTHQERVRQFELLADFLRGSPSEAILLGGDFNTPARAKSVRPLRQTLSDVWRKCGSGWGRTMTAQFPVSRIDQIWVSQSVEPLHARAVRQPLSDHRLLMAEILIRPRD